MCCPSHHGEEYGMNRNDDTFAGKYGVRQILWGRIWNIITYTFLIISICVCIANRDISWRLRLATVGLSLLWGLWYWLFVVKDHTWRERIPIRIVSVVVSITIAAALTWINMVFVILLFAYFGISFRILPAKFAIPHIVLVSILLAARYMNLDNGLFTTNNMLFLSGFLTMAFFASVLGLFINSIARQSKERQRIISELKSTQGELAKVERESGIVAERQRIAGDIHDKLAQGFTSIILQLQNAEAVIDNDHADVRPYIERALTAARESLAEARSVLWALRPEILVHEQIGVALDRTAQKWMESTGIRAAVKIDGDSIPLQAEVETVLLRAAGEALANVQKHARASEVILTLSFIGEEVVLDVQDDGRGFSVADSTLPDGLVSEGYGLLAMRERVEKLGGRMNIESAPGEGTTLAVKIPANRSGAEAGT